MTDQELLRFVNLYNIVGSLYRNPARNERLVEYQKLEQLYLKQYNDETKGIGRIYYDFYLPIEFLIKEGYTDQQILNMSAEERLAYLFLFGDRMI